VHAAPVTWVISDAVFSDGGTLTGQFDYDADINTYTNIYIQSSAKTLPTGDGVNTGTTSISGIYTAIDQFGNPVNASALSLEQLYFPEYTLEFALFFETALTGAGGNALLSGTEAFFGNCPSCDPGVTRSLIAGQVSAVPVPAAVWLFGSALAGLGWLRSKQTI
jgi:hypothetical protein